MVYACLGRKCIWGGSAVCVFMESVDNFFYVWFSRCMYINRLCKFGVVAVWL